jgi:hypothetical protein
MIHVKVYRRRIADATVVNLFDANYAGEAAPFIFLSKSRCIELEFSHS